ncbi:MAG: hypothetical protein QOI41_1955 [Myxococcales bacterium]|nr:hypothetical protein [Myxococcales bacterium]
MASRAQTPAAATLSSRPDVASPVYASAVTTTGRVRAVLTELRLDAIVGAVVVLLATLTGCGGARPPSASPAPDGSPAPTASSSSPSKPSAGEAPEPFEAIASATDVVAPWVRPERSSRLAVPRPSGRTRERWTFAFDSKLDPKLDPVFVVSAGTRIVVQGRPFGSPATRQSAFVLLDTRGHRIAGDLLAGDLVRLEPAAGKFYGIGGSEMPTAFQLSDGSRGPDKLGPDDPRGVQGSLAVRAATHGATHVFIQEAGVEIDDRAAGRQRTVAEPPVVPLDGAIDDDGNLHLLVRQGAASGQSSDLALWTTPLGVGSIGRIRIGPLRRDRAAVPPIVGKSIRVVVLDDRLLAIAPDGKTLWERKGALTGGATLTADDRLLVASDGKVLAIDPSGRATEVASASKEIFLTPPIVTGTGLLLVASGNALHAYGFE